MSKTILHRLRHTFEDTGDILDWIDTSDYSGKEMYIHVSGMWDTMQDAATRIEELEKHASLHAQCDKTSLDLEQALVNRLKDAHKRIEELEAVLREIAETALNNMEE